MYLKEGHIFREKPDCLPETDFDKIFIAKKRNMSYATNTLQMVSEKCNPWM